MGIPPYIPTPGGVPIGSFQPRFIQSGELSTFGLPTPDVQPNILNLVDEASTIIDGSCGRIDNDGNGSLVYTTYTERILLPVGRNLFRVSFRPLAVVPASTIAALAASGANSLAQGDVNYFYTGASPSTINIGSTTILSPLLSASGRYGYARRGQQQVYPDLNYAANILQIASFFGGPPGFTPIDISMCDQFSQNGEIWVPAGLYLSQYTEIVITYNSGYDPRYLPRAIKHACASVVKNLLSRGGGATGLKSLSMGYRGVHVEFDENLIDSNIDRMLQPYRTVIAV